MGPAFPTRDEMTGEHLLAKDWDNGDGDVSFPGSLQGQGEAAPGTTPPGRRGGAGAERALAVLQVACVAVALLAHAYAYCAHLKLPWLGAAGTKGLLSLSQLQLSTWQIVPLCAALLIDAVLRIMSWRGGGLAGRERVVESRGERAPPAGQQRMAEMEEHVGTTVRLLRAMSRQMEKLGVRFRVARRTLRDSLKETAGLAGQTAGIVEILAARSERLEKELAGTQQVLLATQEQAARQLRVFSDALLSSQRSQVALEHRLAALETKRPEGASLHAPSPSPPSSASPPPPVPPPAESAQRAGPAGRVTGGASSGRGAALAGVLGEGGGGQRGLVQKVGEIGAGLFQLGVNSLRDSTRGRGPSYAEAATNSSTTHGAASGRPQDLQARGGTNSVPLRKQALATTGLAGSSRTTGGGQAGSRSGPGSGAGGRQVAATQGFASGARQPGDGNTSTRQRAGGPGRSTNAAAVAAAASGGRLAAVDFWANEAPLPEEPLGSSGLSGVGGGEASEVPGGTGSHVEAGEPGEKPGVGTGGSSGSEGGESVSAGGEEGCSSPGHVRSEEEGAQQQQPGDGRDSTAGAQHAVGAGREEKAISEVEAIATAPEPERAGLGFTGEEEGAEEGKDGSGQPAHATPPSDASASPPPPPPASPRFTLQPKVSISAGSANGSSAAQSAVASPSSSLYISSPLSAPPSPSEGRPQGPGTNDSKKDGNGSLKEHKRV